MIKRRVLVVEDDPMTRGLLTSMLQSADFDVAQCASAAEAKDLADAFDPDALVLDIDLGMGPTGFDIADALARGRPNLGLLFLTHLPDARFAGRSASSLPKKAGYLNKERLATPGVLVDELDRILRGDSSPVRDDLDTSRRMAYLTETQIEVMRMVSQGMSNSQIADHRGTSMRAVTEVISRCFEALGIDPQAEVNARVIAVREYLRQTGTMQG